MTNSLEAQAKKLNEQASELEAEIRRNPSRASELRTEIDQLKKEAADLQDLADTIKNIPMATSFDSNSLVTREQFMQELSELTAGLIAEQLSQMSDLQCSGEMIIDSRMSDLRLSLNPRIMSDQLLQMMPR
ncbi:MAG: hypothetical protein SAJ12_13865 [Jaaginema sp. PMC 1079.18]|nr:hypothetical protein [Jaaginema sp. PMC 1080.18]MEC4852068.1 hypothetical protein [Jaaginema sp. PMC 1079.18]MEC4866463.1 hypothetical protein [Jaaginema sp. PMC 1078.18]